MGSITDFDEGLPLPVLAESPERPHCPQHTVHYQSKDVVGESPSWSVNAMTFEQWEAYQMLSPNNATQRTPAVQAPLQDPVPASAPTAVSVPARASKQQPTISTSLLPQTTATQAPPVLSRPQPVQHLAASQPAANPRPSFPAGPAQASAQVPAQVPAQAPIQLQAPAQNYSAVVTATAQPVAATRVPVAPTRVFDPAANQQAPQTWNGRAINKPASGRKYESRAQDWTTGRYQDLVIQLVDEVVIKKLKPAANVASSGVFIGLLSKDTGMLHEVEINRFPQLPPAGHSLAIFRCPAPACVNDLFVRRHTVQEHFKKCHTDLLAQGKVWSEHPTCSTWDSKQGKAATGGSQLKRKRDDEEKDKDNTDATMPSASSAAAALPSGRAQKAPRLMSEANPAACDLSSAPTGSRLSAHPLRKMRGHVVASRPAVPPPSAHPMFYRTPGGWSSIPWAPRAGRKR